MRGSLGQALAAYRDGLALADDIASTDPRNARWQYDLGISNERIGDVLMAQGDLSGALRSYEAKNTIIERLAKADSGNTGWQRDLSVVPNERLGDIYVGQGQLSAAGAIPSKLEPNDPYSGSRPHRRGFANVSRQ